MTVYVRRDDGKSWGLEGPAYIEDAFCTRVAGAYGRSKEVWNFKTREAADKALQRAATR